MSRLSFQTALRKRLSEKEKAELKAWFKQYHWHPHQLRHNAVTHLRKEFGIEAAHIILGHRSATISWAIAVWSSSVLTDELVCFQR